MKDEAQRIREHLDAERKAEEVRQMLNKRANTTQTS
jgi:hypothetical protein